MNETSDSYLLKSPTEWQGLSRSAAVLCWEMLGPGIHRWYLNHRHSMKMEEKRSSLKGECLGMTTVNDLKNRNTHHGRYNIPCLSHRLENPALVIGTNVQVNELGTVFISICELDSQLKMPESVFDCTSTHTCCHILRKNVATNEIKW